METPLRARGALYGLAIGDALGMPTQMLSRRQIRDRWGVLLRGFEPAPPGHPIAAEDMPDPSEKFEFNRQQLLDLIDEALRVRGVS